VNRKATILTAAYELAQGLGNVSELTRDAVAKRAVVSPGLINAHYHTMAELRVAVLTHARQEGTLHVLTEGHIATKEAPLCVKSR
jgi:AcrR family transcriptional regulator